MSKIKAKSEIKKQQQQQMNDEIICNVTLCFAFTCLPEDDFDSNTDNDIF